MGLSVSYDTKGHTLAVGGKVGPRGGIGAKVKLTGSVNESESFAKSDVKVGVAVDATASAGFIKAKAEAGAEFSVRDGGSTNAGTDSSLGGSAFLEKGNIGGGTLEGSLGADVGVEASAEVSISGVEVVNGVKAGIKAVAKVATQADQSLRERYK